MVARSISFQANFSAVTCSSSSSSRVDMEVAESSTEKLTQFDL
jgi:hypothetical protein